MSELGFDPRNIPTVMNVEFTAFNSEFVKLADGKFDIVFWNPLMPFIKYHLPFDRLSARAFARDLYAAIESAYDAEIETDSAA